MILLTPGPVSVKNEVLKAASKPVMFHRSRLFSKLLNSLSVKLNKVFGADDTYVTLILNGSGTLANESVISSLLSKEDKLLVISNGNFGERLANMALIHGIKMVHLKQEWASIIKYQEVEKAIDEHRPNMLAMVALETSTGMVNPVQEVGKLCAKHGVKFFVDAVSALGSEDIEVKRDKIDISVSVPNKALEGLPGISFVCVKKKFVKRITNKNPNSFSLDLILYYKWFQKLQTPTTPPVTLFVALDKALDAYFKESSIKRRKRYQRLSKLVRKFVPTVGAHELLKNELSKATAITSICFPDHKSVAKLHKFLLSKGITAWFNSHVELGESKNMMQVSVMGDVQVTEIRKLFRLISKFVSKK